MSLVEPGASARAGALLTIASSLLFGRARQIAELAAAHRLPAMYDLPGYVEAGGLIGYGGDLDEIWRRAATFVDKIFKGARPAEPNWCFNFKTARRWD